MWVNNKYIFSFVLSFMVFVCLSQNTTIPDPNFEQALIDLGLDAAPLNGSVPTANISGITTLNLEAKNISDLTGIHDFLALTSLNCNNNQLTNLNVSQNTTLLQLFCNDNVLTSLDVSNLIDLNILWCSNNRLSNLDVTKNTKLISLVCSANQLTNLDTSKNLSLNVFVCENNQLSSLDVSKNSTLSRLQCGNNSISNLDISINTGLVFLSCENNLLSSLDVATNKVLSTLNCQFNNIAELYLSTNNALTVLNCSNNALCRLNLKNGNNSNLTADFQSNINLNCVVVDSPSGNHTTWSPATFLNYVTIQDQCRDFVNVDRLNSVITNTTYTLPVLTYGNYYTQSEKTGTPLFAGEIITSSQLIYIYNESFCANNESWFSVLVTSEDYYIPKYFTPNNDGNHDYWKVQDFNNSIKNIDIFDRYGKLLKSLPSSAPGWNGSFNGKMLATDTYWYVISLNTGETIKGYFALKR